MISLCFLFLTFEAETTACRVFEFVCSCIHNVISSVSIVPSWCTTRGYINIKPTVIKELWLLQGYLDFAEEAVRFSRFPIHRTANLSQSKEKIVAVQLIARVISPWAIISISLRVTVDKKIWGSAQPVISSKANLSVWNSSSLRESNNAIGCDSQRDHIIDNMVVTCWSFVIIGQIWIAVNTHIMCKLGCIIYKDKLPPNQHRHTDQVSQLFRYLSLDHHTDEPSASQYLHKKTVKTNK